MTNDPIRRAIHELVASAPEPTPLPDRDPAPLPGPRSYRWVALAASAALIVAGAVAIAAWPRGDSEAPISSDSTVTVTAPPSPPTTTIPTSPSTTLAPTTTSTAGTSAPNGQPTTTVAPPPPSSTPLSEVPLVPIAGQFVAGPDDLIVAGEDGSVWRYPAIVSGGSVDDRELVLQLGDPRLATDEGPPPNHLDSVAGVIGGSLVVGLCCEPVAGNMVTLAGAGAEPSTLAFGSLGVLSPDGQRMASINGFTIDVWDIAGGVRASLEIDPAGPLANAQGLVWSRDSTSVFVLTYHGDPSAFDGKGWTLVRVNATPPFEVEASADFEVGIPMAATEVARLVGLDSRGNVVIRMRTTTSPELRTFDPVTLAQVDGEWNVGLLPTPAVDYRLAPDGTRLLRWGSDGVWLLHADGTEQQLIAEPATGAWFVQLAT